MSLCSGAEEQAFVDKVFNGLIRMIDSGKVTAECRDAAMELVTKNVTNRRGFGWAQKFLMTDGGLSVLILLLFPLRLSLLLSFVLWLCHQFMTFHVYIYIYIYIHETS